LRCEHLLLFFVDPQKRDWIDLSECPSEQLRDDGCILEWVVKNGAAGGSEFLVVAVGGKPIGVVRCKATTDGQNARARRNEGFGRFPTGQNELEAAFLQLVLQGVDGIVEIQKPLSSILKRKGFVSL